jgi:GAF domain-containing protein
MPREQDLLTAFVEFADTFVDDYDVVEFLHRLATRCVELVDASEAGIMLADRDGTLRYVASSSERMRLIELFELQHDQGPCLDAYHGGVSVHCGLTEDANTRWPRFAPHARDVGFASVSAVPLRLRTEIIGALNLFSPTPGPLGAEDQTVAQALADIATIGILQERALRDSHIVTSQLEAALESRIVIEQAKGIVAERAHVSIDAAFTLLRGFARSHNRLLSQTAHAIIDGTLSPDALTQPARSAATDRR